MKLVFNKFTALSSLLVFCLCTTATMADEAKISAPESILLDKEGAVELIGENFSPNKEVVILFTTADGVESDIGYALKPEPIASSEGKWTTTWSYGRFVKKKLIDAGQFKLMAVDEDFNPITEIMLKFEGTK